MPIYTFYNEKTNEYKDLFQAMNDIHEYIDETGYKWQRIWHKPQACIDSKFSPWNQSKFVEKTAKPGKMKDIYDRSRELSERRKQESGDGIDPISVKAREKYSAERHGKKYISPQEVVDKVVEI